MRSPVVLLAALAACSSSGGSPAAVGPLDRPAEGIVLTGADVPSFLGSEPGALAAFRWSGGWDQVPVQVDERAVVPWLKVYGGQQPPWKVGLEPDDVVLAWCDAGTFTGPDPDATLDEDDEIALDASDAGARAPLFAALPAGALDALELRLLDPLDGAVGWLYLVRHDGSLDPAAGADRVRYTFELLTGLSYLDGYAILHVPNPELSEVETDAYRTGFSDRWIREQLAITAGSASGVDLLDRQRTGSDPPECLRTEDTFCGYGFEPSEGAFLTNVDGPVRAIRSVVGANSGVLTQRDHVFWPRREDVTLHVRVHPIKYATEDVFNVSTDALGARFHAPWTPEEGIELDGDPTGDPEAPHGPPAWEMLAGDHGALIVSHAFAIDDPLAAFSQVFRDDLTPEVPPCTGAPHTVAFGWRLMNGLQNTDPRLLKTYGVVYLVRSERAHFAEAPGATRALAQLRHAQHLEPLEVDVAPFGASEGAAAPPAPPAPPPRTIEVGADGTLVAALRLPGAAGARWSVADGELPAGLALDEAGVLRGRATTPGRYDLALRADHAAGSTRVETTLVVPLDAIWPALRALARDLPLIGRWFEESS